jgi:hypothetical protein
MNARDRKRFEDMLTEAKRLQVALHERAIEDMQDYLFA